MPRSVASITAMPGQQKLGDPFDHVTYEISIVNKEIFPPRCATCSSSATSQPVEKMRRSVVPSWATWVFERPSMYHVGHRGQRYSFNKQLDEAIRRCNKTAHGLSAAVCTKDISVAPVSNR